MSFDRGHGGLYVRLCLCCPLSDCTANVQNGNLRHGLSLMKSARCGNCSPILVLASILRKCLATYLWRTLAFSNCVDASLFHSVIPISSGRDFMKSLRFFPWSIVMAPCWAAK